MSVCVCVCVCLCVCVCACVCVCVCVTSNTGYFAMSVSFMCKQCPVSRLFFLGTSHTPCRFTELHMAFNVEEKAKYACKKTGVGVCYVCYVYVLFVCVCVWVRVCVCVLNTCLEMYISVVPESTMESPQHEYPEQLSFKLTPFTFMFTTSTP